MRYLFLNIQDKISWIAYCFNKFRYATYWIKYFGGQTFYQQVIYFSTIQEGIKATRHLWCFGIKKSLKTQRKTLLLCYRNRFSYQHSGFSTRDEGRGQSWYTLIESVLHKITSLLVEFLKEKIYQKLITGCPHEFLAVKNDNGQDESRKFFIWLLNCLEINLSEAFDLCGKGFMGW